ncbi:hypothetical protein GCM10023142_10980 [Anaerocolumna aminovalerica]|uniref:Loader and inhibitor of phage G40P n=1 Tax=Anaerocolumna aminovalerica TaxID=1527 RepID=A0A1I5IY97_9FIRM|nr:replicative helicase loader/inhibitor [Anaerocolumna aminovalerica]SFO65497.1 Loader and inhibitor of phage G40P [Anaerocolumna aminovalerica]
MSQQEFANIAAMIKAAYPTSNFLPTKESAKTWFEFLKDLDSQTCMSAVREYIRNNEFPPTIAGILKGCKEENILIILEDGAIQL